MNLRYGIGEIGDFVRGAARGYCDRQLQRGNGIGRLPVILLDGLDSRIDRVGGEAEPSPDIDTGGKRAQVDGMAAAGQL